MNTLQRSLLAALLLPGLAPGLPAADVAGKLAKGVLTLTASGPDVTFKIDAVAGGFRVTPLAVATTIDGSAAAVDYAPVTKDVRVKTAGAAEVQVLDCSFPRDLVFEDSGAGSAFALDSVAVARHCRFVTKAGAATATLLEVEVGGRLEFANGGGALVADCTDLVVAKPTRLLLGTGASTIALNGGFYDGAVLVKGKGLAAQRVTATGTSFTAALRTKTSSEFELALNGCSLLKLLEVRAGALADACSLDSTNLAAGAKIRLGGGPNQLMLLAASSAKPLSYAGKGDVDDVVIAGGTYQKGTFDLGGGNNAFGTSGAIDAQSFTVHAGDGADVATPEALATAADLRLFLGDGDNQCMLADCAVGDDLLVKTGAGDDVITLASTTVLGQTIIQSGGGSDTVP